MNYKRSHSATPRLGTFWSVEERWTQFGEITTLHNSGREHTKDDTPQGEVQPGEYVQKTMSS